MSRPGLGRCKVCKMRGTQRNSLFTGTWRRLDTGQFVTVSVHGGACALALSLTHEPLSEVTMPTKKEPTTTTDTPPAEPVITEEAAAMLNDDGLTNPPAVIDPDTEPAGDDDTEATEAELLGGELDLPQITTRDVVEWVRAKKALPQFDPEDVARMIAWQIISAPSLEDALSTGEMMDAQENLYTTLTITGVHWQPSAFEEKGSPVYAVLDLIDPNTGEKRMMTCGGMNVVASMVKADLAKEFPVRCRFTTVTTRSGNDTLKVELVKPDPNSQLPLDEQQF